MEPILQLEDLTKHFPGFCLDHLSLSLPKGTIMGLIGENGAGKTTVINLILHAVEKDGGEIRVFGRDHLRCEKEIKQMIGIVQDQCNLPAMFSTRDVEQVMRRIYTGWDSTRCRALAEQFRLPSERPLSAFSRGMKAKLSFAIALAYGARLLILDEATSNLDPVMRDDILDLLLDFMQNEENGDRQGGREERLEGLSPRSAGHQPGDRPEQISVLRPAADGLFPPVRRSVRVRGAGADTLLLSSPSPILYFALAAMAALMVCVSYSIALGIYSAKRYASTGADRGETSQ